MPIVIHAPVPGAALGHLTQAARTGVQDRGERMPGVADRVAAIEDRQELVRRPQAMVITDAPAYLPQAHGAQGAASMLHTYAAAAPGTRTRSRSTSTSAIWTPLVAAPLRRLSATTTAPGRWAETRRGGCGRRTPGPRRQHRAGSDTCWPPGRRSPSRPGPQPATRGPRRVRRLGRLDPDRFGMAAPDRHPHAGRRDRQIGPGPGSCATREPAWSLPGCCRHRRRRRSVAAR